jgi:hypothetical protein
MQKVVVLWLLFIGVLTASAQVPKTRRRVPGEAKPECAQGSICFSGDAAEVHDFRRVLNPDLDFVLGLPGGFAIVSRHASASCNNLFWVANPPFMAHHDTEIDAQYDWTAEQEVQTSPREFRFATKCADYKTLYDLSQADAEKYFANLESLANGHGRLWITDSRVSHSHGLVSKEQGAVEWIKFSVEIKLPNSN